LVYISAFDPFPLTPSPKREGEKSPCLFVEGFRVGLYFPSKFNEKVQSMGRVIVDLGKFCVSLLKKEHYDQINDRLREGCP
jgi:hypothetical protein